MKLGLYLKRNVAILLLWAGVSHAQVGYFIRTDCDSITSPVNSQTACLQSSTVGGRTAAHLYIRTSGAWVDITGNGSILGTIAADQVAFGTAANTIGGDANFTLTDVLNYRNLKLNNTTGSQILLGVGGVTQFLFGADVNGFYLWNQVNDKNFLSGSVVNNNLTLFGADQASQTMTFSLSGATDPVWTFSDGLTTISTGNLAITALTASRCVRTDGSKVLTSLGSDCGTVTSVAQTFTGGLISVAGSPITLSGTLALTVAGTSGGIPYFDSATSWASSGALTANLPVIGGGAGVAPSVGTRSGNTTAFVTTTGAQTSGDCVKIDANGNHIAAGAACGTGGGTTQSGAPLYCADAGANDTYTCTLTPTLTAYTTGMVLHFKPNTTNIGTASVNADTVGPITIVDHAGNTLTDGLLVAGRHYRFTYDGTNFVMDQGATLVDLQVYTVTGANTWTKPAGAKTVIVRVCGAGGGGGGGTAGACSSVRAGGGGGGGGYCATQTFLASDLAATETISIGVGGTGTTGDGGVGGNTTFSSTKLIGYGGGGGASNAPGSAGGGGAGCQGAGGSATTNAGTTGGMCAGSTPAADGGIVLTCVGASSLTVTAAGTAGNASYCGAGSGGGSANDGAGTGQGALSFLSGAGGGAGGGTTTGSAVENGAAGGSTGQAGVAGGGGAAGVTASACGAGGEGQAGTAATSIAMGMGGGGGSSKTGAGSTGCNGGAGGAGGGGGGGGGSACGTGSPNAGSGGAGGNGKAWVWTYF